MDEAWISKKFLIANIFWSSMLGLSFVKSIRAIVYAFILYPIFSIFFMIWIFFFPLLITYILSRIDEYDEDVSNRLYIVFSILFGIMALSIIYIFPIFIK
ncbi:MAG: hypothetical protein RXQ77_02895 [Candidatus Nanopusillus sp.]